jgi:hypothetical protein
MEKTWTVRTDFVQTVLLPEYGEHCKRFQSFAEARAYQRQLLRNPSQERTWDGAPAGRIFFLNPTIEFVGSRRNDVGGCDCVVFHTVI